MSQTGAINTEPDTTGSGSKRIAKNAIVLVSLRVFAPVLSVALLLVLSRMLGSEGLGRYSLAYGFLYLFNTIAPMGLYPVITRDGARKPSQLMTMVNTAFSLGTLSSVLLTIAMMMLAVSLGYDVHTRNAIVLLSIAILPFTLANFLEGACVAIERMDHIAYSTLAEYIFKVGLGIGLLLAGYGLEGVLVAAIAGRTLACIIMTLLLRNHNIYVRWAWDAEMRQHLARLAPAFVMIAIFATLYWRIDIFMLSKLATISDVGQYGAGYRLLEFAMIIPQSICLALYPQMALLFGSDQDAFKKLGVIAARYLLALCLPLVLTISLGADFILNLMYGNEFIEASATLKILIWTLMPYLIVRFQSYVLLAGDKQNVDLYFNIFMAAINVGLNLILIPRHGHLGAAIATLVSIIIYSVFQRMYFSKYLSGLHFQITSVWIMLLSSLVLLATFWLTAQLHILVGLIAAPLSYAVCLTLAGFFSRSELAMLNLLGLVDRLGLSARLRA